MAAGDIRVRNTDALVFGTMAAEVVATHFRVTQGTNVTIDSLDASVTVDAGQPLRAPANSIELLFPHGEFGEGLMDAMAEEFFDGVRSFTVDAMTSATAVVTDGGYSAVATTAWTVDLDT